VKKFRLGRRRAPVPSAEGDSLARPRCHDGGVPETGWTNEPIEPEPPRDWRRVEILADALTKLPPRDFAVFVEMAGEEYEPELRAAVGIAVNVVNVHLAAYPPGSPQYLDAAARADELHRLTMGDD
jgi:DNA-directed RNA polymerase specialized sigma24 family protein